MQKPRESSLVIFMKAFPPQLIGVMAMQIAVIIGVLMLGGVFLGLFLDARFGTKPLLTLGFAILSAPLSVFITYKLALRTVAKSRKAYLDWKDTGKQPETNENAPNADSALPKADSLIADS